MAEGLVAGTTIYRVTVHGVVQQQNVQFSWHVRQTGFADATDAEDVLPVVKNWIEDHLVPATVNTQRYTRCEVMEITSKEFAQEEYTNLIGSSAGDEAPSFVAYLVSLRSGQRARHRNGRMYWFNTSEGGISGSTILQGAMTTLTNIANAWATQFITPALTEPFQAVIVAQARPATANRPQIEHSWIDVSSIRVSNYVSHQVRRKIGRGS